MAENEAAPHSFVKDGIYYCVRRVPKDLLHHHTSPKISFSLRTRSASVAASRALRAAQRLDEHWYFLRITETGAGILNLSVAADSYTQNIASVGIEASAEIARADNTIIRPYINLRWEHLLDGANATAHSFVAALPAASFASPGAAMDRNRFGISAGIEIETSKATRLDIRYDGSISSGFEDHRATVQFTMRF